MISKAGESLPNCFQDKEGAENIGFKTFHFCLIHRAPSELRAVCEVDQKENLIALPNF